jgi:hypothetical protein
MLPNLELYLDCMYVYAPTLLYPECGVDPAALHAVCTMRVGGIHSSAYSSTHTFHPWNLPFEYVGGGGGGGSPVGGVWMQES